MRIERTADGLKRFEPPELTISVGNFDGVHRGHQAVLQELASSAGSRGTRTVVVTFCPHPLQVISPDDAPRLLSPGDERSDLLAGHGVDVLLILPFTPELARLSAEEFLRVLSVGPGSHLVLGYDFHMGSGRRGDVRRLGELGRALGFGLDVVPPVTLDGRPISSSRIREELDRGDLKRVNVMLGRPYVLRGDVVPGAGRGRDIGFPTLNLELEPRKQLPADGVYLSRVIRKEEPDAAGLLYVGRRPTVESRGERRAEVHLPAGVTGPVERLTAELLAAIRGDRSFSSENELSLAIERDIEAARSLVRNGPAAWRTISF